MIANSEFVQIGKRQPRASYFTRIQNGPVADKFFLCGLLAAVFALLLNGLSLWLLMRGQISTTLFRPDVSRIIHAHMQIHFFVGAFILGFYLQALPRLFDSHQSTQPAATWILLSYILANLAIYIAPHSFIHGYFLCISYLFAAAIVYRFYFAASLQTKLRLGVFSIFGLSALAFSSFADLANTTVAFVAFWCGVMPIIFAASQQFIVNVLSGSKLSVQQSLLLLLFYFYATLASLSLILFPEDAQRCYFNMSLGISLTVIYFLFATKLPRLVTRPKNDPFFVAFIAMQLWLCVGSILLWFGAEHLDAVLHIWATGVIVPLLMTVTARILGVVSGKDYLSHKTLTVLLIIWQLLPVDRGLARALSISQIFSGFAACAAGAVILIWSYQSLRMIKIVFLRQFFLRQGETMPSC